MIGGESWEQDWLNPSIFWQYLEQLLIGGES
jgi:hypothetical protein